MDSYYVSQFTHTRVSASGREIVVDCTFDVEGWFVLAAQNNHAESTAIEIGKTKTKKLAAFIPVSSPINTALNRP
jgi:hypothetical protein